MSKCNAEDVGKQRTRFKEMPVSMLGLKRWKDNQLQSEMRVQRFFAPGHHGLLSLAAVDKTGAI